MPISRNMQYAYFRQTTWNLRGWKALVFVALNGLIITALGVFMNTPMLFTYIFTVSIACGIALLVGVPRITMPIYNTYLRMPNLPSRLLLVFFGMLMFTGALAIIASVTEPFMWTRPQLADGHLTNAVIASKTAGLVTHSLLALTISIILVCCYCRAIHNKINALDGLPQGRKIISIVLKYVREETISGKDIKKEKLYSLLIREVSNGRMRVWVRKAGVAKDEQLFPREIRNCVFFVNGDDLVAYNWKSDIRYHGFWFRKHEIMEWWSPKEPGVDW